MQTDVTTTDFSGSTANSLPHLILWELNEKSIKTRFLSPSEDKMKGRESFRYYKASLSQHRNKCYMENLERSLKSVGECILDSL